LGTVVASTSHQSMTSHRFHVAEPIAGRDALHLEGERAHYLGRVLRLTPGTELTLFDGLGGEYRARIQSMARARVELLVLAHLPIERESALSVRVLQGISRGERMDFAIQKATELGVANITPVHTRYGVVRLKGEQAVRRHRHWQEVAISACEQCGRNRPPVIDAPQGLEVALAGLPSEGPRWLLHPAAATALIAGAAPAADAIISVLIGPEGGLSEEELALAGTHGFEPRRLGPRVLRTETAAAAVLAALQSRWGDLGG
jgi:16S rRNA (uracil1498-N3)-methyltransferase